MSLKEGGSPGNAFSWKVATLAGGGIAGDVNNIGSVARFNTPVGLALDGARNIYVADTVNNKIRTVTPTNGFFPLGTPSGSPPSQLVELSNADGVIPIPNPTPQVGTGGQPYIKYAGALADGDTTAAQNWAFIVPNGVNAFEFNVSVEANTSTLSPVFGVSNPGPTGVGSPNNLVRTIAGRGLAGFLNGTATEAQFSLASGIAVDHFGNRYVSDTGNNSIRRISRDGFVSTVAGTGSAGDVDGAGNIAQFSIPDGIAVSEDGRTLYVADSSNQVIRRISIAVGADPTQASNWVVSTIAGNGAADYIDNNRGDLVSFNWPFGIAISPGGSVYVSELFGNRIRRLQLTGSDPSLASNWRVNLVAGSTAGLAGEIGSTDGHGTAARFASPSNLAVDRIGNVYVADNVNNRIRKVTPDGQVSTIAGSVSGYVDNVGANARFSAPQGIAVDSAGYIYVADSGNSRIRRISPTGVVTTVAGGASGPTIDHDGRGNEAVLYLPSAIAVDDSGSLVVVAGGEYEQSPITTVVSVGLRIRLIERINRVGR